MGELVRQLDYKISDQAATLVEVGRYYPSSQTCSRCGARTKLPLWQRVYDCTSCSLVLDRDVNAARNIRAEGERLLRDQHEHDVASIRGETRNGEPRPGETEPAPGAGGHGSFEAATDPAAPASAGTA
jgi:putative transposase